LLLSGEQHARELSAESEAIAEAIKLLAPGISRARKEYSRKVAEQRGEEYQAIVERIVDAAKRLVMHFWCTTSSSILKALMVCRGDISAR